MPVQRGCVLSSGAASGALTDKTSETYYKSNESLYTVYPYRLLPRAGTLVPSCGWKSGEIKGMVVTMTCVFGNRSPLNSFQVGALSSVHDVWLFQGVSSRINDVVGLQVARCIDIGEPQLKVSFTLNACRRTHKAKYDQCLNGCTSSAKELYGSSSV